MQYKRKESFRHVFEQDVDVKYKLYSEKIDNEAHLESESCRLVDLSPSGARIALSMNLPTEMQMFQIELNFVLYAKPISVVGFVKWKRPQNGEYLYGIDLDVDEEMQALIIYELKLRRRQEVKGKI